MARMEMSDAFAVVLRKHRAAKGLSRQALAEKACLHQTYVGLVERGLRNPSLDSASALAEALGVLLSKLISEAEALRHKK